MRTREHYLIGLGTTSLSLGWIGLLLFFMPILSIPISAFGLVFGVIGFVAALWGSGAARRSTLQGLAFCVLALGVNVAIRYAPRGYLVPPHVPALWQPPADRPYVPPPAD